MSSDFLIPLAIGSAGTVVAMLIFKRLLRNAREYRRLGDLRSRELERIHHAMLSATQKTDFPAWMFGSAVEQGHAFDELASFGFESLVSVMCCIAGASCAVLAAHHPDLAWLIFVPTLGMFCVGVLTFVNAARRARKFQREQRRRTKFMSEHLEMFLRGSERMPPPDTGRE